MNIKYKARFFVGGGLDEWPQWFLCLVPRCWFRAGKQGVWGIKGRMQHAECMYWLQCTFPTMPHASSYNKEGCLGMRHMVTNLEFRHSCSQSLSCNFHPIHCHPKIKCMGTGYKFPRFLRSLLYATEYKNTFNPPPHPPHCHIKEIGL